MKISWGKDRVIVKEVGNATAVWRELNTPVEDSTELQTNEGDKMEAKIEGGEYEDVRYKASTYAVNYNIRKVKDRPVPIPNTNGVVSKHYSLIVIPEDPTCIGIYIEDTVVKVNDSFTTADGAIWQITHEALKAESGNTVKWGTASITGGKLSFNETQPAEDVTTGVTITNEDVIELGATAAPSTPAVGGDGE